MHTMMHLQLLGFAEGTFFWMVVYICFQASSGANLVFSHVALHAVKRRNCLKEAWVSQTKDDLTTRCEFDHEFSGFRLKSSEFVID